MNVHTDGELIPLIALPALLRAKLGRSPDKRTIKRWRRDGLCGGTIRLECTRRGSHWYTTADWLDDFFRKQEEHRKQNESISFLHQMNTRRALHRKQSRQANRSHEQAKVELSKTYPGLFS